jgi:hypothetical protein
VWAEVEARLAADPKLKAVTLFARLQRDHPGRFSDGQRRSFERRVRRWRALSGPAKPVTFEQVHPPGRLGSFDFTDISSLDVTIDGRPFPHLLFHLVLTCSNAESVRICFSESFEALSAGLQAGFQEFGGVPQRVRSDSLSAAVNNLSHEREFRERYQGLLDHYQLEGEHTNAGCGNENGDVESSHRHFKTALDQSLRLRGSRDFESQEEYDAFVQSIRAERNMARDQTMREELTTLRPLPLTTFDAPVRLKTRVGGSSTIQIRSNTYSVHSRLIGEELQVLFRETTLEVYLGDQLVETLPRLHGRHQEAINYRHVIDSLGKKPGAFIHYRYQAAMFPTIRFRLAYDDLCSRHSPRQAAKEYVKILHLAAIESEDLVERALHTLAHHAREPLSAAAVKRLVQDQRLPHPPTSVHVDPPDLQAFDSLLQHKEVLYVPTYEVQQQALDAPVEFDDPDRPHVGPARPLSEGGGVVVASQVAEVTDVPRTLSESGDHRSPGIVEPRTVSVGADGSRVSRSGSTTDCSAVAEFSTASRKDLGDLPLEAPAREGHAASAEPARRGVPVASDQPVGVWLSRIGEEPRAVRIGSRTGSAGSLGAVHSVFVVGAGAATCEAGLEAAENDRAVGEARRLDHRRPGLCPTEPRGDGGLVHVARRAVRASECVAEQQPAVLSMGANLQGSDDHSRRDRSTRAPQCDRGIEHPELPIGCGQTVPTTPFLRIHSLSDSVGNFNCR